MLTFKLFQLGKLTTEEYNPAYFNFLLRAPAFIGAENPLEDWLPNKNWGLVLKLSDLEGFENFATNMEKDAPTRFKEWFNEFAPEDAKLPLDWKRLDQLPFQKLLVLRCLRPDRTALRPSGKSCRVPSRTRRAPRRSSSSCRRAPTRSRRSRPWVSR